MAAVAGGEAQAALAGMMEYAEEVRQSVTAAAAAEAGTQQPAAPS